MNLEYFSSRVEYIVNVLNIPLNILLDKPSLINQTESLRDLLEYCDSINYNFYDISNYIFIKKRIKDIKQIIEVCKANGIKAEGTVFTKSADEIVKIIEICKANGIEVTGSVFMKPADEIVKIIEVCKANGIEVTGSVFMKPADEIVKIIEVCKANGIKAEGTVFLKPAEEIVKIIEVCKANGIKAEGNVFTKSVDEIVKIIEVCQTNNIQITGTIFKKKVKNLTETIDYLKQNYGNNYLKPLLIVISPKKIGQVFPYLDSFGVLPTVINSASILTLSLEEIIERKNVLDSIGEPLVVGNRFNSIFGLSKKNYAKKLESLNIEDSKKHL